MKDINSAKPVCLITGVGPGTGTALVQRFVEGGYRVAMLARDQDRLQKLASTIPDAHEFACDVTAPRLFEAAIAAATQQLGAPDVVIHNAVAGAVGDFLEIDPEALAENFAVNTLALLHLARMTVPNMLKQGRGALLCTGNTSAYRGKSRFAGFAPSKAAQRILMESIARRVGPEGVHAAYIAIDAVIDVPWTRERLANKPDSYFTKPNDIAEECFRIAHQPRSAWSFQVELRPFGEAW